MLQKSCIKDKKSYKETNGCKNLAKTYLNGQGVKIDTKKSIEILDETCKIGVFENYTELAEIYLNPKISLTKQNQERY